MTTVILAEKPSQARAYVDAFQKHERAEGYYQITDALFSDNTVLTYGFGHLVAMATPDAYGEQYGKWQLANLPLFPDNYQYIVPTDKKKQFAIVKKHLKDADTIIVATDADREGENIAWSIMVQTGIDLSSKTIKRLWINSLERDAIRTGFQNLREGADFYPIYQEAKTRQISDWLVGMNASPLYTLLLRQAGGQGVYSIGRVQTPTLYMVYQRDMAIKNFKPEPYVDLDAEVTVTNGQSFTARLEPYQRFKDSEQLSALMTEKQLIIGSQDATIADVSKKQKTTLSPRLFSLSSLQSAMNKRYHISASDTLAAVQKLYEAKLLTYPRTDCNYITDSEHAYLVEHLTQYRELVPGDYETTETAPQSRYVNGKKVQEHHAIIMTRTVPSADKVAKLPHHEQLIYTAVLKNTLAMFFPSYKYEETTIRVGKNDVIFKAVGNVPVHLGWKALFKDDQQDDNASPQLPTVVAGESVQMALSANDKLTKPPVPFTEGTLITAMKTAGKTLDDSEAQEILKSVEGIGTEATRANVLELLKRRGYIESIKNKIHVTVTGITLCTAVAQESLLTSPEMTARWEKALAQIATRERSPENFLEQIKKFIGNLVTRVPEQLQSNTAVQSQITAHKSQVTDNAIASCPKCQTGSIVERPKFYGCTNYGATEPCTFSFPKHWSGKKLGKKAIQSLIKDGKTALIKGFKSKKTGKTFDAKLKIANEKLVFDFDN